MPKKSLATPRNIGFIETMDCLSVSKLPEGSEWTYEIKLDGYRLEAVRNTKEVTLYSRRRNVLNNRFGYIATALEYLPAGTVIDGEVVGLGPDGHADFYLLQKFRSAQSNIVYYAFDILVHEHRDLTRLPLSERREIITTVIKPDKHVALSVASNRSAPEMLEYYPLIRLCATRKMVGRQMVLCRGATCPSCHRCDLQRGENTYTSRRPTVAPAKEKLTICFFCLRCPADNPKMSPPNALLPFSDEGQSTTTPTLIWTSSQ